MPDQQIPSTILIAAEKVIRDEMGAGVISVQAHVALDTDGDPSLIFNVGYATAVSVSSDVVSGLVAKLRSTLAAMGELRTAFVRHRFHDTRTMTLA